MIKRLLLILVFGVSAQSFATVILDTLYINRGTLAIGGDTLKTCVFNDSANFNKQNKVFELNPGDQLLLHVINNDVLEHTFTIDGLIETGNLIPAGGALDFYVNPPAEGSYRFYSDKPYGKLLGASSIITLGYENHYRYYWNLFDQQDTLTDKIDAGTATSIPMDYMPEFFTVNMKVGAELEADTLSYMHQMVGDTIILTIANSGNMHHNLHFHGYHVTILQAAVSSYMVGWIKDSFPVVIGEVMIVRIVPHQPGMYMVHNHNLIAGNEDFPEGMMSAMEIMP